jgi:hypothetical protein
MSIKFTVAASYFTEISVSIGKRKVTYAIHVLPKAKNFRPNANMLVAPVGLAWG